MIRASRVGMIAAVVAAGVMCVTMEAHAQPNAASANVTATVQQPITVTKNADLEFGDVFPGVNKTIEATDAEAAEFQIAGQASALVNMTFTLPSELTKTASSETMPITTWTGLTNTTQSQTGGTTFTPAPTPVQAQLHTDGNLYVYIGATVEPPATQEAGTYTATVTLTVVYF